MNWGGGVGGRGGLLGVGGGRWLGGSCLRRNDGERGAGMTERRGVEVTGSGVWVNGARHDGWLRGSEIDPAARQRD